MPIIRLVRQEFVIGGVISGNRHNEHWAIKSEAVDFFDLKGDLESILISPALENIKFVAKSYPALHPGQSAAIMLGDEEIGFIGTIHPRVAQKLDLNGKVVVFEVLWDKISHKDVIQAKEISRFLLTAEIWRLLWQRM